MKCEDRLLLRILVAGLMAVLAASGCTQKNRAVSSSAGDATVYSEDRPMVGEELPPRYYRDDSGKLYYADPKGGLRVIEKKVRVESGGGGLYTIVDDNNVRYYHDESGKLYHRDDTGRPVYIEEVGTGKVIDPLPILRGGGQMRYRSAEFCTDELKKCLKRCDESRELGSKRSCFDECDFKREQCLQPY